MALVLDASALARAALGLDLPAQTLRRRLVREVCHAPHLVDAEVGHALRRQVLRGLLPEAKGESLLGEAAALVDHRHQMTGWLALAAWKLRQNLTFYDALYAALAQALAVPLLTCDESLARSPGLPCTIELVA